MTETKDPIDSEGPTRVLGPGARAPGTDDGAPRKTPPTSPPIAMPARIGRYEIKRLLGKGGMAEVFLASQAGPAGFQKTVVVKRIRTSLAEQERFVEMFLREARVVARLNHNNVVQVFELGEDESGYFIAMEYLDGVALSTAAKRTWAYDESIPMEVVLRSMADAALGLHHAHTLRDESGRPTPLIHRDISPDNLFLTRDGVTKVLDFGIAKSQEPEGDGVTRTGELKGKVPYMSPEQIRGDVLDGRSDLFSLGVTFYQLLTGERPFRGPSDLMILDAVLRQAPAPPRNVNPLVPPSVQALVMRMLEKDHERRPASGLEVHDALVAMLGPAAGPSEAAKFAERMASLKGDEDNSRPNSVRTVVAARPTTPYLDGILENLLPDTTPPRGQAAAPRPAEMIAPLAPPLSSSTELLPPTKALPSARGPRIVAATGAVVLAVAAATFVVVNSAREPAVAPAPAAAVSPIVPASPAPEPTVAAAMSPPPPPTPAATTEPVTSAPPPRSPARTTPRSPPPAPSTAPPPPVAAKAVDGTTSIQARAPAQIRWETLEGRRLGRGTMTFDAPKSAARLAAIDPERGVRVEVAVEDGAVDYARVPKGTLALRVKPWARVFLGTQYVGQTPFDPIPAVAGRYVVRLEHEGTKREETVVVEPGRETLLKIDMRAP